MHGGGWFAYMRSGDEKPKVTKELLLRVLTYAREYWWHIAGMLFTILLTMDCPCSRRSSSAT